MQPGEEQITVTYLEMRRRPRRHHPHGPPGRKLALLRAERPPLHFYRYLYSVVGEPWRWTDRLHLSDGALAEAIHDPAVEIFVLYVDGCAGGFFELDRRNPLDVQLAYCGLVPDYIGQGLGLVLIEHAVEQAWRGETEPSRVWVHTCSLDHPRALLAYQRAGFVPYREEHRRVIGMSRATPFAATPSKPLE